MTSEIHWLFLTYVKHTDIASKINFKTTLSTPVTTHAPLLTLQKNVFRYSYEIPNQLYVTSSLIVFQRRL